MPKSMARSKPPKPLTEAPPEPDSSDDEENSLSSSTEVEEGPEQQAQDEEASSSSGSSDEEETEPQQQTPKKPQPATPTPKKSANDSSDEEEEEDDDSPVLKAKHITSPSKSTSKPRSKPIVAALTPEKEKDKRPLEIEEKDKEKGVSSKKPRKEKSIVAVQEEGTKKQVSVPFQRLYSADDEIAILKGMIDFRAKKGADPMFAVEEFYEFIKNSLHVDVNRGQVVDKIRRLKKRYYNSLDKKKKLTNPHEIKFFELCQKIWNTSDEKVGNEVAENSNLSAKSNSKPRILKIKGAGNGAAPSVEEQKNKVEEEKEKDWKITQCDQKDVEMEIGEESSKERLRKKGMKLMGAKSRAEISEMWDKVIMAQRDVDELRYNVLKEENKRIVEALKSGKQ